MQKLNILISTPVGRTDGGEYIDYFPSRWSGSSGLYKVVSFYPYNLAYLSSYMKLRTSHNIKMIDPNFYGVDTEEYISIVKKHNPDIFVVEIDAIIEEKMLFILNKIKILIPNITIIVCGPCPTANPKIFLNNSCDFVAIGEFEKSIVDLILSNFDKNILGIYPNERTSLIELDLLPFPENKDINRRDYCRHYGSEFKEIEIFSTRRCPHMCNFCVIANVYANKPSFRVRNVSSVIEEIKYLKSTIPDLEGLFFNEDSHTSNRAYIIKLLNAIIDNELNDLKYNCMTNYDTLDFELLELMKKAGYYKIRIGIETLDESISKFITKTKIKSNHSKLFEVLKYAKELDIKVYVTMSVGVRNSTFEKDLLSLEQLKLLYLEGYIQEFSVSMNTPMPGTPFYEEALLNKWMVEDKSFNGSKTTTIEYPNYKASQIEYAYKKAVELKSFINKNNIENNVRYSMYDKEWCKPVYDVTNRKVGEQI